MPFLSMVENGVGSEGAAFYAVSGASGLQIADGDGLNWAPAYALSFNVMSDSRMKQSIDEVQSSDYANYMSQIRNITSATYKYNWESEREDSHIGVIAQTLPKEVQVIGADRPGQAGEERLGMSLADMAGLTLVGVKALDEQQLKLEQTISTQQMLIEEMQKEIAKLKMQIEK